MKITKIMITGNRLPSNEWFEHERNVFGVGYDMEEKNKGLRLRLLSDGYLSIVNAVLRPPRNIYVFPR
jgi:hypothetical protein